MCIHTYVCICVCASLSLSLSIYIYIYILEREMSIYIYIAFWAKPSDIRILSSRTDRRVAFLVRRCLSNAASPVLSGWATGPLQKGFVAFGMLSNIELLQHLVPRAAERKRDPCARLGMCSSSRQGSSRLATRFAALEGGMCQTSSV